MLNHTFRSVFAVCLAGHAMAGCLSHRIEATRAEVDTLPADGVLQVERADGVRRAVQVRDVAPRFDELLAPADILRHQALPADPTIWESTRRAWGDTPAWSKADVEFRVMEPAEIGWVTGGVILGGALGAVIGYEAASCSVRSTHSCEDAGTIQGFTAFLSAGLGMALGAAGGVALHEATRPEYHWIPR